MAQYSRPPKSPTRAGAAQRAPSAPPGIKIDPKTMPFAAYMDKRQSGSTGTGSNSVKMLRDRAARLRSKAHARSAAREMS